MVNLIGVTGHAGVGKTTGAKHLSTLTGGRYLYLGQTVLDEIHARGLPGTPDDERHVRVELRRVNGAAAMVLPFAKMITECLEKGTPVFVDAIFMQAEFDLIASLVPGSSSHLLAIHAPFDVRCERLACRPERPLKPEEILKRDNTELKIGTDVVIAAAKYKIFNEGTIEQFYEALEDFVTSCN